MAKKKKERAYNVYTAYDGSNGGYTRAVLKQLEKRGAEGWIAAMLFRAQKASTRAKQYRGRRGRNGPTYRELAYEKKGEALEALCDALQTVQHDYVWGWGTDEAMAHASDVLYINLPEGQVSFHSTERYEGPRYRRKWDGQHLSEDRILKRCASAMYAPEHAVRMRREKAVA